MTSEKRDVCTFCGTLYSVGQTDPRLVGHVCGKCGAPQPISPNENYFTLLRVRPVFKQDLKTLEDDFYHLSRSLHPDRFANASDSKWKTLSVNRMTAINQAYQTLLRKEALREYLFEVRGILEKLKSEKRALPADLAEEWFEVQDQVLENPESARTKIDGFSKLVDERDRALSDRQVELEQKFDESGSSDILEELYRIHQDVSYLHSLKRDISRLRSRVGE